MEEEMVCKTNVYVEKPYALRVFEKGVFIFAAFEKGEEIIIDLGSKKPKEMLVFLMKMFPLE